MYAYSMYIVSIMKNFDIKKRCDYDYAPGMTIDYLKRNLQDEGCDVITKVNDNYVEISNGKPVNKCLILDVKEEG